MKRDRLCVAPKYPGKPSDYIFVEEHCRKTSRGKSGRGTPLVAQEGDLTAFRKGAEADYKKIRSRVSKMELESTGSPVADALIRNLLKMQSIIPEYTCHMFSAMVDPTLVTLHPSLDKRWQAAKKTWRGPELPQQAQFKLVVAKMLSKVK